MRGVFLFFVLTACAAAVTIDVGCDAYAEVRISMPTLNVDPLSQWVARLDDRMTGTCRP